MVLRRDAPIERRPRRRSAIDPEPGRGQAAVRLPRVPHASTSASPRRSAPARASCSSTRGAPRSWWPRSRRRAPAGRGGRRCSTRSTSLDVAAAWEGEPGRTPLTGIAVVTDAAHGRGRCGSPADHLDDAGRRDALGGTTPVRGHNAKALMRSLLDRGHRRSTGLALDTAIAAYLIDPAEARYDAGRPAREATRRSRRRPTTPAAPGQLDLDGTSMTDAERAGRDALAVHAPRRADRGQPRRAGHGRAVPDHREPAGRRAGQDGARRHRRRRRRTAGAQRPPVRRGRARSAPSCARSSAATTSTSTRRCSSARSSTTERGLSRRQEDQDRLLDRRRDAGEAAGPVARVHRPAAAVPRGREAARHLRRGAARRGRAPTGGSTPRSTRPSPAPAGSAPTSRTCTTSRCAATRAGSSARRSSRARAARCSSPTTTRSSCAASPTWPPTRA